jgi:transposase
MKEHKKAKAKTKSQTTKVLAEHQPNAAGIDLGAEEIWVAVPAGRDQNPVRRFEAFTRDLMAIVQWLLAVGCEALRWKPPACTGYRFINCSRMQG